jgi:hypothetical protein
LQLNYVLYPNPNQGKFTFEYYGDNFLTGMLKIVNISGKEFFLQQMNGNIRKKEFDLKLPSGVYFLQYIEGEKAVSKKIVIL